MCKIGYAVQNISELEGFQEDHLQEEHSQNRDAFFVECRAGNIQASSWRCPESFEAFDIQQRPQVVDDLHQILLLIQRLWRLMKVDKFSPPCFDSELCFLLGQLKTHPTYHAPHAAHITGLGLTTNRLVGDYYRFIMNYCFAFLGQLRKGAT